MNTTRIQGNVEQRRSAVLAAVGLSEEELCHLAETDGVCGDEWAALAELAEIDCENEGLAQAS